MKLLSFVIKQKLNIRLCGIIFFFRILFNNIFFCSSQAVWEKVIEGGPMSKALFKWAYQYKLNRLHRGYPSPMLDQLVFHKIRALLGGRIRMMVSGGAPLSPESQNFINIVFCPIAQG